MDGRGIGRLGKLLLLVAFVLALGGDVAAQEDEPGTPEVGEPRLLERETPEREPRVVERPVTPEGTTNTIVVLPAEADTYIASEWPQQNFGEDGLYLGYDLEGDFSFGAERILIRFDIAGNIPAGAVVNDARLQLYLNFSSPSDDVPMPTVLREIHSAWGEDTVTWDLEPTWGDVRGQAEVDSASGWYEWEITGLVADWVGGAVANHGCEIIGDEAIQERERVFYSREAPNTLYPRLVVDYTDLDDTEPPVVTVDALPTYVDRDFTVSWSGTDPGGSGIATYDVQYRVNGGAWADWITDTSDTSAVFAAGLDGRFYEFRARGEDRAGNVEDYDAPEASTTVDTEPPTTIVEPLPTITTTNTFTVSWTGHDDASGIQYYDVRYRFNDGGWILWQDQSLATSTSFTAMNDGVYDFEARAVDNLGLVEAFNGQPEASIVVDTVAPFVVPEVWLALIFRNR